MIAMNKFVINLFIALILVLPAFLFAQSDSTKNSQSCIELYKLNIHYSKNDVPQKFQFMYRQPIESNVDLQTILLSPNARGVRRNPKKQNQKCRNNCLPIVL